MKNDGNNRQEHVHFGRSSRALLDPAKVLMRIGLKSDDTFLDAGSGDGYMSLGASEIVGNEGKVFAVDAYEEAIVDFKKEIALRKIGNIQAFAADITKKTMLGAASIDVCLLANILHGFVANNEVEGALTEIGRVLKTGGILAVVEFKKIPDSPGPPLEIKLAPEDVAKVVTPYEFLQDRVTEVGPYHYAVIFVKKSS